MPDFRSFRASTVVMRHSDWGEADRLLTLYTREQGKVRALAKGVRKMTSRKGGHLEPFTYVTLQLAKGRDLLIVTQAETVNAFLPLHEDLVKTGYAAYVVELLDRLTYEDDGGNASRARPSLEVQKEAEALMQGYFTYILERELNTPGFIKRVKS